MSYSISSSNQTVEEGTLYFEGIKRPLEVLMFRDAPQQEGEHLILERYFNDIYSMFLNRLSNLVIGNNIEVEDEKKLKALLDEMLKVKAIIERNL